MISCNALARSHAKPKRNANNNASNEIGSPAAKTPPARPETARFVTWKVVVSIADVLTFWERNQDPRAQLEYDDQIREARTLVMQGQAGISAAVVFCDSVARDIGDTPESG